MLGLSRFLFLSVITVGVYPVFLALRKAGRTFAGSRKPKKVRSVPQRDGEFPPTAPGTTSRKRNELILVSLSEEQIAKAKDANGSRKRITHALICGPHGQMLGTEKQCLKYYLVWRDIFPALFSKGVEMTEFEITDYRSTFDLVNRLLEADDSLRSKAHSTSSRAA